MPKHDIVVIGASAGGLQALTTLIERLPETFAGTLLVVMHTRANGTGVLPDILGRAGRLPAMFPADGQAIQPGRIYVARPDHHLLVTSDCLRVLHGPRENGFRPAIDPLFRTAARAYGARVVGIILSGALSDGTYGLSVIKQNGGLAVVQDPVDAIIPTMPRSAMAVVDADYVIPALEMADLLMRLTETTAEGESDMAGRKELEPQLPSEETEVSAMQDRYGPASSLTCPDCGGALWEVQEGRVLRYQCHVGHQYAPDALETAQRESVEGALWTAVRVLEEHAELKMRMATRAAGGGLHVVSEGFRESASNAHQQAQEIRAVLFAANGHEYPRVETVAAEGVGVAAGRATPKPVRVVRKKSNSGAATSARKAARPKKRKQ